MGSATCRHSYPTCGRPSFPALIPDPLEQENLRLCQFGVNNNVFWSWHIVERFWYQFPIYANWHVPSWVQSAVRQGKCHVRGKCVVRCVAVAFTHSDPWSSGTPILWTVNPRWYDWVESTKRGEKNKQINLRQERWWYVVIAGVGKDNVEEAREE